MAIKNYTTSISVEKTIMEIEKILTQFKATHIYKMYDGDGNTMALAFKCLVDGREIAFKLPMEHSKILQVFQNQVSKGKLAKRYWGDDEQARRTGWRIIKDWVASQLALFEIHLAKPEEIFLPYMYDETTNETLFQKLEKNDFNLQLTYDGKDR